MLTILDCALCSVFVAAGIVLVCVALWLLEHRGRRRYSAEGRGQSKQ